MHRVQSVAQTRSVIDAARASGFRSVNVDLIYGLPRQTRGQASRATLEQRGRSCDPDRIALYSLRAPARERFTPQRRIAGVRAARRRDVKLAMLMRMAIRRLRGRGLRATSAWTISRKPGDDARHRAARRAACTRNFQGYSHAAPTATSIGLGVSAIGKVGPTYSAERQDARPSTTTALDHGRLAGRSAASSSIARRPRAPAR